jgi:hypothetical protein
VRVNRINDENGRRDSIRRNNRYEAYLPNGKWKEFRAYLRLNARGHTVSFDPAADRDDWVGRRIVDAATNMMPASLQVAQEEFEDSKMESVIASRLSPTIPSYSRPS